MEDKKIPMTTFMKFMGIYLSEGHSSKFGNDVKIYDIPCVTIIELMGRNAGWLTAAAALARNEFNELPQLIYLPETDFDAKE